MVVRIFATVCWIGVAGVGIHMMRAPSFYEDWAAAPIGGDGFVQSISGFLQSIVDSLGGIDSGRVMTILGSCMIAGTWIPTIGRKKNDEITIQHACPRGDERILMGEVADEPQYEYKI